MKQKIEQRTRYIGHNSPRKNPMQENRCNNFEGLFIIQEKILNTNLGCSTSNILQRKYWTKDWSNDLTLSLENQWLILSSGKLCVTFWWPLRQTSSPWAVSASPLLGIMLPLCFGSSVRWEIDFRASSLTPWLPTTELRILFAETWLPLIDCTASASSFNIA